MKDVRRNCKLYSFPNAPTEHATELTIRIQNILHSPTIARYEVTYKLYRRQAEKLMTLQLNNNASLYCYCDSAIYELGLDLEPLLVKLKAWTLRQTMKIVGSIHEIDHIDSDEARKTQVSVGVISQGPSTKGIVIELREAAHQVVPTEGHLDEHVLRDIMGTKFQTLMVDTNPATSVVLSTGTDLPIHVTVQPEKIQIASAYFEMFSKL